MPGPGTSKYTAEVKHYTLYGLYVVVAPLPTIAVRSTCVKCLAVETVHQTGVRCAE